MRKGMSVLWMVVMMVMGVRVNRIGREVRS
jgi:hypothetical protein